MNIPSGKVTFLFTEIEDSAKLAQGFPETLQAALEKHHSIILKAIESNNGFVIDIVGDAFGCAFGNSKDAVKAAVEIQINLAKEKSLPAGQGEDNVVIKVKMGIHYGNAEWNGKRYMGYITLARTSRIMSAAYGEQILISNDAYELIKEKTNAANLPARDSILQSDFSDAGGEIHDENDRSKISFRDLGERRLKDVIHPIRLFQIISNGLREEFPPIKTLDARPNNLPVQLTSFIGREKEMSEIKKLLSGTKLLTLIGAGGIGKTRLALQVAADIIDDFANGVRIVELASLVDPILLPKAISDSLALKENPSQKPEQILIDYLKDKELLLIFDNCEHIINACANLAENLLQSSPKIKIIATSRESLRCKGEVTHKVFTLAHPNPKEKNTAEQLSQYEAVRLFIERALAVNPGFRVNNENAPALAQICFQLDGIPLAIELAASRTKILSLEKIFKRLDDRFNLLTEGKRTSQPRQQTLRAMIDWSYDLLSEQEKILWRRLSVFSGGWTLEDVEEICSDENISQGEILDLISELAEKSIVIFNETKNRYRMLETIRQYSDEKLRESAEFEKTKSNHFNYFLKMAVNAEPELFGPKTKEWFDRFEVEHSNIQSALSWSLEKNLYEEGNKLVCSLDNYWEARGYSFESGMWLEKLMVNPDSISPEVLARSNRLMGIIEKYRGNSLKSKVFFEAALKIHRSSGNKKGASGILNSLGLNAYGSGDLRIAREYLEEGLNLCREVDVKNTISVILNSLGLVELMKSEFANAKKYFEESLEIARTIGNEGITGIGLNNLAVVETYLGEYEKAEKLYNEVLKVNTELGNKFAIARTLSNLGNIHYLKNDFEKAQSLLADSLDLAKEIESKLIILDSIVNLGQLALGKGEVSAAKLYFIESLNLQKESPDFQLLISGLIGIAAVKLCEGKPEASAKIISVVRSKLESTGTGLEKSSEILYEKTIDGIKQEIGNDKTIAEMEKGKEISLDDAVELALSSE
ncbi:MAG: tetratricopeptide repeat protein [Bacteroidota bacterium]|nr:tetratricopeptide repeat protein [Bacteroidota bacterium]